MNNTANYWFTIEPYVYVNIVDKYALLYNTLDGTTIESKKTAVITLLNEMLQEENCGVVLLKDKQYKHSCVILLILTYLKKSLSKSYPILITQINAIKNVISLSLTIYYNLYLKSIFT